MLITRPALAGAATADRVRALGLRPVLAPLSAVERRAAAFPPADHIRAVLVTSANALDGLPRCYRRLPLFAGGDATSHRARAAGFAVVRSAAGDAMALAALVRAECRTEDGELLLATGAGQGGALTAALRAAGLRVRRRETYAMRAAAALPAAAQAALAAGELRAALFFSAEGARIFVRLLRAALPAASVAAVEALTLSDATAAALAPLPWQRIRVASHPNQDELLALLR